MQPNKIDRAPSIWVTLSFTRYGFIIMVPVRIRHSFKRFYHTVQSLCGQSWGASQHGFHCVLDTIMIPWSNAHRLLRWMGFSKNLQLHNIRKHVDSVVCYFWKNVKHESGTCGQTIAFLQWHVCRIPGLKRCWGQFAFKKYRRRKVWIGGLSHCQSDSAASSAFDFS